MSNSDTLEVKILDKDYMVACPEEEKTALQTAASQLDKKMREIRASGKVHGTERIAVMAALNITYEMIEVNEGQLGDQQILNQLEKKLNNALKTDKASNKT